MMIYVRLHLFADNQMNAKILVTSVSALHCSYCTITVTVPHETASRALDHSVSSFGTGFPMHMYVLGVHYDIVYTLRINNVKPALQ